MARAAITDSFGQVFTPFASLRADAASMQINSDPGVANYIGTGNSELVRAMPTVGLEYRYPFISVESWGTQTVEPIAQVIARPNETQIGKWPNEDAQSLIFDDSNLFRVDKFSGWDRVEGGGRANYGVQYTAQFNQGGFVNALFGQSYSLFGQNSFAAGGIANTGLDSGLDTTRPTMWRGSPTSPTAPTPSPRASASTTTVSRCGAPNSRPAPTSTAGAPACSMATMPPSRESASSTAARAFSAPARSSSTPIGCCSAAARYDINAGKFDQTRVGLGYVDDCLILALNYITNYVYSGNPTADHQIMLQLTLRTLGGAAVSQGVSGIGGL